MAPTSPVVVTGASASTGLSAITQKEAEQYIGQEVQSFTEHIQNLLAERTHLSPKYLPISDFFDAFRDGVLLGELIDVIKPGLVDTKKLKHVDLNRYEESMKLKASAAQTSPSVDTDLSKTMFEVTANLNQVIEGARKVGIVVVNIGPNDFIYSKQDLVLGIVWQLIRFHLLQAVNLNDHPELVRLLQPNESLSALLNLPAESTLIRWFNYHLQKAGVERTIKNFSKDVQDSELYIRLLNEIAPPQLKDEIQILMAKAESLSPDSEQNRLARATLVLEAAGLLGARKFATAKDIVSGNAKLNLGLTATIFNREIGINLPSEEDIRKLKTQIQSQREDITELQKVIETKDNTITQLGLMMRGKDERILDLNERMREATLNRLEEKDALEKQVTETKKQVAEGNGELASYKKKIAADFDGLRDVIKERNPEVVMEGGDAILKSVAAVSSMLQELKDQKAEIERLKIKIERDMEINNVIGGKIREYAEQKAPKNSFFGSLTGKKSSQ